MESPVGIEDVARIDTSMMEPSTANIVNHLKAIVLEQTQRINVLKHLNNVDIQSKYKNQPSADIERIMGRIQSWIRDISEVHFFKRKTIS